MSENKRPRNINNVMMFRLLAIGYVLYMLYQVVMSYFEGGPDAPSIWLVVLAVVLLGGGAALIGVLSWREYKRHMEETALRKAMEEEELAAQEEEDWEEEPLELPEEETEQP